MPRVVWLWRILNIIKLTFLFLGWWHRTDWSFLGQTKKIISTISAQRFSLFNQWSVNRLWFRAERVNNSHFFLKVWVCIAISLIVMALAMTFFSCIYRKYLENDNSPSVSINRLGYFGRNLMFLWSHLTNHCKHFNQIVINLNLKFPISHFSAYFIRLNSRRAIRIVVGVWCLLRSY